MPLVTLVIGTSWTGTPFQTSFQIARLTSPCNLLTPFEWRLIRNARIVILNGSDRSTRVWPNEKSSSNGMPSSFAKSPEYFRIISRGNESLPAGTFVWGVEIFSGGTRLYVQINP